MPQTDLQVPTAAHTRYIIDSNDRGTHDHIPEEDGCLNDITPPVEGGCDESFKTYDEIEDDEFDNALFNVSYFITSL